MVYRFRRRLRAAFRALSVVTFLLLCAITFTPLVPDTAGRMTADWYEGNGDILVVLGGAMLLSGTGPTATLAYDSYLRIVYAAWVLHSRTFPWIVVSGGNGLAQQMKEFLVRAGIPEPSVLEESRSQSTFENALYVKGLLQRRNLLATSRTIVILTSDYHCWRARRVFERLGIHVRVIPVPDVGKRSSSRVYRWQGFFTLLDEFGKDIAYGMMGRL